ncbi:hypothetical protein PQ478_09440 [Alkalihalophilus pseudofirmus]|nr:hypothetical protein [Alkalihalophilus pseudofirmus]WEG18691.1 hypothetical protein PQ478_09440 [Alkalihalophilus pseudofirmus]
MNQENETLDKDSVCGLLLMSCIATSLITFVITKQFYTGGVFFG